MFDILAGPLNAISAGTIRKWLYKLRNIFMTNFCRQSSDPNKSFWVNYLVSIVLLKNPVLSCLLSAHYQAFARYLSFMFSKKINEHEAKTIF